MATKLARGLSRNEEALNRAMNTGENDDLIQRGFTALEQDCLLYYIDGMSSAVMMSQFIVKPLQECKEKLSGAQARDRVMNGLLQITEISMATTVEEIVEAVFEGQCALLMDGLSEAFIMDTRSFAKRSVSTPLVETVVSGPHEAFNEALRDNLSLLHRMVHSPLMICKVMNVGTEVPTQLAVIYMKGIARREDVDEITRRINQAKAPYIISGGMLEQLLEDSPFAPLPQVISTERPDRAVSFIMEGQVLVLLDGSPQVMAMPVCFWHFMHAPDDSGMRFQYGTFSRLVRAFGAVMALLLPAVFLSIAMYHPASISMSLLTSIMDTRVNVPISLFGEAAFMMMLFNLINEAGMRVPGIMGSSLGLVSTLILGTAAVDAGLVSPLLIIVIALGGTGCYAIPNYALSLTYRILQFILLLSAGFWGLYGVSLALLFFICWVAGMQSLGRPYLAPLSPQRAHNPDHLFRAPVYRQRLRTWLGNPFRMLKLKGRMRP